MIRVKEPFRHSQSDSYKVDATEVLSSDIFYFISQTDTFFLHKAVVPEMQAT